MLRLLHIQSSDFQPGPQEDLTENLHSVVSSGITKYKGCLIYSTAEGYLTGGRPFKTLEEAKQQIDNTFITWNNSLIKTNKNGNS